jgi:hypothetical protein
MATSTYIDETTPYATTPRREAHAGAYVAHESVGGMVFLWLAWALAAAFWAFTFTTALGIMEAVSHPVTTTGAGGADAGGVQFALIDVVGGVVVLGLAIAYGLYRYSTRDKMMDPVTEVTTKALYDRIERDGDDESSLSPEAHKPEERTAYRDAKRSLG